MINWVETEKIFGYSAIPSARRPKVVCICDKCGKQAIITIRVKGRTVADQMSWFCPSCVKKRESAEISARMKKQWENEEYKRERKEYTEGLLCDEQFRRKHKVSLRSTKPIQNIFSQKASITVRALWGDDGYRNKMMVAIAASKEKLRKVKASDRYRIAVAKSFAIHRNHSSIQLVLYELLTELGIVFEREGEATRVGYYRFDCLVFANNRKILIECQGDYWHKLPRVIARDKAKLAYISNNYPEYRLIYIWEHEFSYRNSLLDKLMLEFGAPLKNIMARN
jgi:hypothetical protein